MTETKIENCEQCGAPLRDHPDWVLPDRTVKYCNGVPPQPELPQFAFGSCGEYL
jgi:hypothetical protein